jgi:ATP-dependent exoDNAse (exonuclease V) alpha subunit
LELERKEELEKTKKVEKTATAWGCLEISNTRPMTAQLLSIPQLPFQLTCDQEQALKAILEFLDSDQTLFLLGGFAGTGKTTLVSLLVKALVSVGKRIALTAPTNKAVNVLQRMAAKNELTGVDFFTIHQLLGLGIVTRAGEKVLERTGSSYAHAFHVVFIDECSMIGEQLWHWIEDAASLYAPRLKIVLMGDPAQLNPVNEKKSPSFSLTNRAVLKQVVRQGADSPLLEFVTTCRQAVTKASSRLSPAQNTRRTSKMGYSSCGSRHF